MKKALIIMISAVMPFLLNSCKPDNNDDDNWPKEWYIPQEVLDYFYFQPGTFWVYENDVTHERDSVFVTSRQKGMTNKTPKGESYEIAGVTTISALDGYTYKYNCSTQGSAGCVKDKATRPCYGFSVSKTKVGDVKGESSNFFYPFQIGYKGYAAAPSYNTKFEIKNVLDTLKIGAQNFFNIMVIEISNSITENNKDAQLFWAKDIGVILKRNITDNQNWQLVNYNIIK